MYINSLVYTEWKCKYHISFEPKLFYDIFEIYTINKNIATSPHIIPENRASFSFW